MRQENSLPLIEALKPWLKTQLGRVSQKGKLAEAIRYTLARWEGLSLFLDDGRVEMDSNIVERSIRPIALNRNYAHHVIMRSPPRVASAISSQALAQRAA